MKKVIKILLLTVLTAVVLLTLFACKNDEQAGEGHQNQTKYFGFESLNYNSKYVGAEGEKGFFIYDEILLNKITISNELERREGYDITYRILKDGVEIYKSTDNKIPYLIRDIGELTIEVTGGVTSKVIESHTVKIADNNLPTRVEFVLKNASDEVINHATAGETAKIEAKLYNKDTLIETIDTSAYNVFWSDYALNDTVLDLPKFANAFIDEVKTYDFCIQLNNNYSINKKVTVPAKINVKNNLEKIEHSYNWDSSKVLNIDVSKQKAKTDSFDGDFGSLIKLNYLFTNGEKQDIELSTKSKDEYKGVIYIKYANKQTYSLYNTRMISNQGIAVMDMSKYNFDPRNIGQASIYLSVCGQRTFDVQDVYKETKLEDSVTDINITKTDITALELKTYSGKYAKFNSDTGRNGEYAYGYANTGDMLDKLSVIDNNIKIFVNTASENSQNNEYLTLNINMNTDASCPEYVVRKADEDGSENLVISDSLNDQKQRTLKIYALREGSYKIKLISVFGDVPEQEFTIVATNPVIGYRLEINDNAPNTAHLFYEGTSIQNVRDYIIDHLNIFRVYHNRQLKGDYNYRTEGLPEGTEPTVSGLRKFLSDGNVYTDEKIKYTTYMMSSDKDLTLDYAKFVSNQYQYKLGMGFSFDGYNIQLTTANGFNVFLAKNYKVTFDGVETNLFELLDKGDATVSDANYNGVSVKNINKVVITSNTDKTVDCLTTAPLTNATVNYIDGETTHIKEFVQTFTFFGGIGNTNTSISVQILQVTYSK